jgi:hypothetical protein
MRRCRQVGEVRCRRVEEMRCHRPKPSVPALMIGELERRLMEQVGAAIVAVEPVHKVPRGEARQSYGPKRQ